VVTSIKYVSFAMRVDNDGEGGILALMSLLGVKRQHRPVIVAVGLFGAALIYGDGAITPAISVLSALEGLDIVTSTFRPYILPAAVVILVALFAIQPLGTGRIGRAFGPIMALWFLVMAMLGLWGIMQHPTVLFAIDPRAGLAYLRTGGLTGFLVLGGVFLCVTGAEALYADMGHFGPKPIRLAWSALVFPSLVLNYAGQAALVLEGAPTADNIFYRPCPPVMLVPLVLLATIATIIASQSIITGAFSMTRQAIQLGWLPRLQIVQTSERGYGQIYVGAVNWLLMIVTLGLTIGFGKSDNLAAAYGIAVSATMLMTTALLFIAMREIWHWTLPAAAAVASAFFIVDI
jgi:KUP system potassium uptake protein